MDWTAIRARSSPQSRWKRSGVFSPMNCGMVAQHGSPLCAHPHVDCMHLGEPEAMLGTRASLSLWSVGDEA